MRRWKVPPIVLAACLWTAPLLAAPDESKPQPELAREPIVIVSRSGARHLFHLEAARTPDQQIVGLMWRKSVPEDGGMLFDWGYPRPSDMWMKNTLTPLDMVFVGEDGVIRHIAENTVPRSLAPIDSGGPVRATLELAAGVTAKNDIAVGDRVEGLQLSGGPDTRP